MKNLFVITLIDLFQYNPFDLPGGFVSLSQAADYLDRLVNFLADQGFTIRRHSGWIEVSSLVTIAVKPTDQCHWQRSSHHEELLANFEFDLEKVMGYILESEERMIHVQEELAEMANAY